MQKISKFIICMLSVAIAIIMFACSPPVGDDDNGNNTTNASTSPIVVFTSPSCNPCYTNVASVTISGTASITNTKTITDISVSTNEQAYSSITNNTGANQVQWSYTMALSLGSNTISVQVTTENKTNTATMVLIYDTNAPTATASPSGNVTTNQPFTVTFTVDENYFYWSTNSGASFNQFAQGITNVLISSSTALMYYGADISGNTTITQTVNYTIISGIDLSASNASTATNIEFYHTENTYSFPFYVASVIRAVPDFSLPLTNDGVPLSPVESDNVLIQTMNAGVSNTTTNMYAFSEYKFQGDPTTEMWSYNSTEKYYQFTVNKSRFNYGVDSLVFCSSYFTAAWGGPGSGIGQNAIPQQASMGIGNKIFDIAVTNLDLGITPDASIKWVATNSGANSITMIGIKNDSTTFDLYLKGSVVSSNVMADLTNATGYLDIWCQFMVVFGKQ